MKGIKIQFQQNGASFDFSKPVENFENITQNALINTGTQKGSDPIFEDRGTDLFKDAAKGSLVDVNAATHASNFAALETIIFLQQQGLVTDDIILAKYELQPVQFTENGLQLNAIFTSSNGEIIGRSIDV